ncbi:UDP-glucuronosyl/UDP-glucosyltransferase [Artemisia annua]|uniref:UDP-glucuronosyl/UDP-glucosyltransferase n=1 Tax=Artemisia annua TaxID=35608 RepID=A0A2U1KHL8_ARTAN|nr:UDP-glucuronosyl/UDP-glucosyltransferase [Artemisia annua]
MIIKWLDKKATGSTVFVSFGGECFLSSADLEEIAYGLEMSNMNFIWVLRFPKGDREIDLSKALALGFLERVKNRGLVVKAHSDYLYADQGDLKIEVDKFTEKIYQEVKKPPASHQEVKKPPASHLPPKRMRKPKF